MRSVVYSESVWVNFQQESMTLCSLHVFFFYHSQLTQNLFNNLAQLKITSPFTGVNGLSFYGLQVAFGKRYICWFMYKPRQGLHHLFGDYDHM